MKIIVDRANCMGHTMCNLRAPDLFPLDDEGYTALGDEVEVDPSQLDIARQGVAACPERVFELRDS